MGITNVRLQRQSKKDNENLIFNGDFSNPKITGPWEVLKSVPGWQADSNGMEIGPQTTYNSNWPAGIQVCDLDAYKNVDIYQSIFLNDKY
jgi:hypothetical protein